MEKGFAEKKTNGESYSKLSFEAGALVFSQQAPAVEKEEGQTIEYRYDSEPTKQEIQMAVDNLQSHFSNRGIRSVVNTLYQKVRLSSNILTPGKLDIFTGHLFDELVCKSFYQLGFGWLKMKRYLQDHNLHVKIDEKNYSQLINRLLLKTHRYLGLLVGCQEDTAVSCDCEEQLRITLSGLRNCTQLLQKDDLQCFFALLEAVRTGRCFKFSKTRVQHLHKQLKELIFSRIKRERGDWLQIYKFQDSVDSLSDKPWSVEMLDCLMSSYIQSHTSLSRIKQNLSYSFPSETPLFFSGNIKTKLKGLFKTALLRLQEVQDLPECLAQGSRFRRLVYTGGDKFQMLVSSEDASEVRLALLNFHMKKVMDLSTVIFTILQVNEYINRKDNQAIRQSLLSTKAKNSICRPQYQFAGKRKKVLVLKQLKKKDSKHEQ